MNRFEFFGNINIMGHEFLVEYVEDPIVLDGEVFDGMCHHFERRIEVYVGPKEKRRPRREIFAILVHEIWHAICRLADIRVETEEHVAILFESIITDLLERNGWVDLTQ